MRFNRGGAVRDLLPAGRRGRALLGLLLALLLAVVLGLLARGDASAVASCLNDAELSEVDNGRVSTAEDTAALGSAPEEANDFVSAEDAGGRGIYVLVYDSVSEAESAQALVAPDLESGARGNKLVVFSSAIGNQDRLAVEECFLDEVDGGS